MGAAGRIHHVDDNRSKTARVFIRSTLAVHAVLSTNSTAVIARSSVHAHHVVGHWKQSEVFGQMSSGDSRLSAPFAPGAKRRSGVDLSAVRDEIATAALLPPRDDSLGTSPWPASSGT